MTDRINEIIQNKRYRDYVEKTRALEAQRVFCRHDMAHFLDVARIGALLNQKEQCALDEEMIYAAALLHDIGRWRQYETGEDHAAVSAELAPDILEECGFTPREREMIVSAIASHRDRGVMGRKDLNGILYRADKLSRPCFACTQEPACDWKGEKKNLWLKI